VIVAAMDTDGTENRDNTIRPQIREVPGVRMLTTVETPSVTEAKGETKMLTGISAEIRRGYTGNDHLIDSEDETSAVSAVAGNQFRRASDARNAAEGAFLGSCDRRVRGARVVVTLRTARGDVISVG